MVMQNINGIPSVLRRLTCQDLMHSNLSFAETICQVKNEIEQSNTLYQHLFKSFLA